MAGRFASVAAVAFALMPLLQAVVLAFPISELALALAKRGPRTAQIDDRGSMRLLWLVIISCVAAAIVTSGNRATRLPFSTTTQEATAASLILGGLVLRWAAVLTLGTFFTVHIAIHAGQRVITAGPYRYVRHPSYSGLLVAFLGLGIFFGNWISVIVLTIPIWLVVLHRIRLEESVLATALGPAYSAYCARTKRLIPWVF